MKNFFVIFIVSITLISNFNTTTSLAASKASQQIYTTNSYNEEIVIFPTSYAGNHWCVSTISLRHMWTRTPGDTATYEINDITEGIYELYYWLIPSRNNAESINFSIEHNGETSVSSLYQKLEDDEQIPAGWVSFGDYFFKGTGSEKISTPCIDGPIRATKIRLVPLGSTPTSETPISETKILNFSENNLYIYTDTNQVVLAAVCSFSNDRLIDVNLRSQEISKGYNIIENLDVSTDTATYVKAILIENTISLKPVCENFSELLFHESTYIPIVTVTEQTVDNTTYPEEIIIPANLEGTWEDSTAIKNYNGGVHHWTNNVGATSKYPIGDITKGIYRVYMWRLPHIYNIPQMDINLHQDGETKFFGSLALKVESGEKVSPGWIEMGTLIATGDKNARFEYTCNGMTCRASAIKLVPQ